MQPFQRQIKGCKTAFILTFAPASPGSPYKVQKVKTTLVLGVVKTSILWHFILNTVGWSDITLCNMMP